MLFFSFSALRKFSSVHNPSLQGGRDNCSDERQDTTGVDGQVSGGAVGLGRVGAGRRGGATRGRAARTGGGGSGSSTRGSRGLGGAGGGGRRRGELRGVAAEDLLLARLGLAAGVVGAVVEAGHDVVVRRAPAVPIALGARGELGVLGGQARFQNVVGAAGRGLGSGQRGHEGDGEQEELHLVKFFFFKLVRV